MAAAGRGVAGERRLDDRLHVPVERLDRARSGRFPEGTGEVADQHVVVYVVISNAQRVDELEQGQGSIQHLPRRGVHEAFSRARLVDLAHKAVVRHGGLDRVMVRPVRVPAQRHLRAPLRYAAQAAPVARLHEVGGRAD